MRNSTFSWLPKTTRENAHPYYLNKFRRKIFLAATLIYVLTLITIFSSLSTGSVGVIALGAYVAVSIFTVIEIVAYWYWIEALDVSNKAAMIGTLVIGSLPLVVSVLALSLR